MASSATLPALLEALPDAAVLLDAAGVVLAVNEAWRRLARANGYDEVDRVVGRSYFAVCDGACALSPSFIALLGERLAELTRGGREEVELEDRVRARDDGERWLKLVARRVRAPGLDGVLLLHLDTTAAHRAAEEAERTRAELERLARERAEELGRATALLRYEADERQRLADSCRRLAEELHLAQELLATVLARSADDAIRRWDVATGEVEWSEGITAQLGHERSTVAPTAEWWLAHVHPDDRARVEQRITAAIEGTADRWREEYRFRRGDGTWAEVVDRGFIVRDAAGRALRAVGALEDVTERRRSDEERAALLERERHARAEAEAANRAKDEFLAIVSHELRTPLAPILGFVDVLREEGLDPAEAAAALDAIERNARTLKHLIDDLLDVARITSGKMTVEFAPVRLRDVVASALESLRPSAEVKGLRLHVVLGEGEERIAGDAQRLLQVVSNLVSNSIKFTPRGGTVHVSVTRQAESAVLTVSDSGKGIAPELLPHVFERFRQGDTSDTRVHGGLGLGLAIVHHIVEMHGGTIVAHSPGEGQGATFVVTFPLLAEGANS